MKNELCRKQLSGFDENDFKTPPLFFRPGVLFPILCEDDLCGLTEKFRDLKDKGIGRVAPWLIPASRYSKYTGSTLGIDYDTPEYWQAIKALQAAGEEAGLSIILHDEPGWPSGQAGGKVLQQGGAEWIRHILSPEPGNAFHSKPLKNGSINPDTPQPDLLRPDVGKAVVELVLEKHKQKLGGSLPDCMPWIYADEPTFGGIGHHPAKEFIWTPGFEKLFEEQYGYSVEPFLPELTDETLKMLPKKTAQARVDYFDLLARLFETSYLKPVFDWCGKNRIAAGGHLLLEHDPRRFMEGGHGHLLRSFRYFHIPGVDSIFQESHPLKRSHYFPKYASSIARQTGRWCSSMPFGASSCAVTPAIHKWTIDHQLVRGINLFLAWGYSPNNDIHYQWSRPVFGHIGPLWKYMDIIYRYTARLSYLLSCGVPECRIAVYFDMRSIWAGDPWLSRAIEAQESIANALLQTQHDFDFVDDLALKSAQFTDGGKLCVGQMTYDILIVPETVWMEPEAEQVIREFKKAGGTVLYNKTPDRPLLRTATPQSGLRVCKRNVDSEAFYFLVNEGNTPIETTVIFEETGFPEQLDPETGSIQPEPAERKNGKVHLTISLLPWESRVYRFSRTARTAVPHKQKIHSVLNDWMIRPVEKVIIEKDKIVTANCDKTPLREISLGDWCQTAGATFSGTIQYQTRLRLSPEELKQAWKIDLGEVKSACCLSINGERVGQKLWAPFSFALPETLLKEENILTVEVSNTLSNLFTSPAYLNRVDSIYSPAGARYVNILEAWEKEACPSGLFGPVCIYQF